MDDRYGKSDAGIGLAILINLQNFTKVRTKISELKKK